jgi:hypothetical protein
MCPINLLLRLQRPLFASQKDKYAPKYPKRKMQKALKIQEKKTCGRSPVFFFFRFLGVFLSFCGQKWDIAIQW